MKDTNQQTNAKGGKKGKRFSAWYILGGGVLKEDFVVKHTRMILLVVCMIFFFIGNRYTCDQKLKEIDRLQQVLARCAFRGIVYLVGADGT